MAGRTLTSGLSDAPYRNNPPHSAHNHHGEVPGTYPGERLLGSSE